MNSTIKRHYARERARGVSAVDAFYYARIRDSFDNLGDAVRLRIEQDTDSCLDDLKGDCYNPKYVTHITPSQLAKQEKEFEEEVEQDGVWGIIGEYWNGVEWCDADSCFGFVGDSWKSSGYDVDIMASTIEQYSNVKVCECCGQPIVDKK